MTVLLPEGAEVAEGFSHEQFENLLAVMPRHFIVRRPQPAARLGGPAALSGGADVPRSRLREPVTCCTGSAPPSSPCG